MLTPVKVEYLIRGALANTMKSFVLRNKETIITVLIVCAMIALTIYTRVEMAQIPQPSLGTPTVVMESVDLSDTRIRKIVHDDHFVYVLSYNRTGYVQVYDWNGEYQQTLLFYGPSPNGGFHIASVNNTVYVQDNEDNLYVLKGCEIEAFIEKNSSPEQWRAICDTVDFQTASDKFVVRQGDIWRIENDNELCVVDRPFKAFVFQYSLDWVFMMIAMLIVALSIRRRNKKRM